jgi:hypothetical protein
MDDNKVVEFVADAWRQFRASQEDPIYEWYFWQGYLTGAWRLARLLGYPEEKLAEPTDTAEN